MTNLLHNPVFAFNSRTHYDPGHWVNFEFITRRMAHYFGVTLDPKNVYPKVNKGHAVLTGAVYFAGMPLRNQVLKLRVRVENGPLYLLLRSTDAFGEIVTVFDFDKGEARALAFSTNRTMWGGVSHSSPMPEEMTLTPIAAKGFHPLLDKEGARVRSITATLMDETVRIDIDGTTVLEFDDPDPAGGRFGVGSPGTVYVESADQSEIITNEELERRKQAHAEMREFCTALDAEHDGDVRRANEVVTEGRTVTWTWPRTGCSAVFTAKKGGVDGIVKSGLYGDSVLMDGSFTAIQARDLNGVIFKPDPKGQGEVKADARGLFLTIPMLGADGRKALAWVQMRFTIHTTWWWEVFVEGVEISHVAIRFNAGPEFPDRGETQHHGATIAHTTPGAKSSLVRTNDKSGLYFWAIADSGTKFEDDGRAFTAGAVGSVLKFASQWLPAQPYNKTGFRSRMVHFIRYTEGPIEQWRERPSYQIYPSEREIARYAAQGTHAMVWHHTWTGNNLRERDGFVVNHEEMKRAMDSCHRHNIAVIPYIGIVPARNPLLSYDALNGPPQKDWDLQDFGSYKVGSDWSEFFPWQTDKWCREYGIDGYYADGGFAGLSGEMRDGLTLDEQMYRLYYRLTKVFKRNNARFGLECWGGAQPSLVTPFYDCRMIGESFHRAAPELYRDRFNALLTGTPFKMYAMRDTCQDPYNMAMAAVNLSDIQMCSGCRAWGCHPDDADAWARVKPFWNVMDTIDWERVTLAMPWYAQTLVEGGVFAAHYNEPDRVLLWIANKTEKPAAYELKIRTAELPVPDGNWTIRQIYPQAGEPSPLGDGALRLELPSIEGGPLGFEICT